MRLPALVFVIISGGMALHQSRLVNSATDLRRLHGAAVVRSFVGGSPEVMNEYLARTQTPSTVVSAFYLIAKDGPLRTSNLFMLAQHHDTFCYELLRRAPRRDAIWNLCGPKG